MTTVSVFLGGSGRTWEGSETFSVSEIRSVREWYRNSVATQSGPSFLSLEKLTVSFAAMKGHHNT